jgi:ornithine decarboxylase
MTTQVETLLIQKLTLDAAPLTLELAPQSITVPQEVVDKFDVETVTESVEELIAQKIEEGDHEEAFYIVDLGAVLKQYKQWISLLPRVKPFYAIKCNSNPAIVKTLGGLGVNFDCASKAEIQQILGSGYDASRIIYANPTKMKSHINYAKTVGVDLMTFDNSHELHKVAECFPNARLVLRIITDDSHSICKFSTKFGAPMTQTKNLLKLAKELGLNVVGISFHVGSGCMSTQSFSAAIKSAAHVFEEAKEVGYDLKLLDLGGGWPGTDDDGITFSSIANCIRPILDDLFPANVEIIAEPGRYFCAASHTLAVNVFAKRTIPDGESGKRFLYYINDGVYQSFNCIFFDHSHPMPLVFLPGERTQNYKCTIFGPTCDSMDCIAKDIELPELEVGEWLYFKNMGAYTVAAASPFNGFKSCPTIYYTQPPSV